MTATATGSWYEVQGLALCPAHGDSHPRRTKCKVPDEGEWHGIYFLDTRSEAEEALLLCMESDSPIYERYEDFRLAIPDERLLKRRRTSEGFPWERRRPRKVDESATRSTIATGRKKAKRKKVA